MISEKFIYGTEKDQKARMIKGMVEDDCHNNNLQISKEQEEVDTTQEEINASLFDEYIKKIKES